MIGTQFDGPGEGPLHMVPQSKKLNRGAGSRWTEMERKWANALENGDSVSVKIEVEWPTAGKRPDGFNVEYTITNAKTGKTITVNDYFDNL